jgi:hypothetical protein
MIDASNLVINTGSVLALAAAGGCLQREPAAIQGCPADVAGAAYRRLDKPARGGQSRLAT